jgi:D-glycero-alpha-D-manno-heptose 1-phosphate guanylyltransferase
MEAVILAGGLGTRLRERLPGIPKAMAPVAGRPFLAWLLDQLASAGFKRVILSVGYLGEAIRSAFGGTYGGIELVYAIEGSPLGTGGALRHALGVARQSHEPIWVMNGDSILRLDYAAMWSAHANRGTDPLAMTMAITAAPQSERYGVLRIEAGRVIRFSPAGEGGRALISAGTYLVHRDLFAGWTLPATFSFEADFLARFTDRLAIAGFVTDGWFIDIGVPADYERAQIEFPAALQPRPAAEGA